MGSSRCSVCVCVLACVAQLACVVHASPGDVLAKADFRSQDWVVEAPKGTGSVKGLELDYAQNAIKLKDAGKHDWWFESPKNFFKGDMTLAYNGSITYQLQSLEWETSFYAGYDIVLVSSSKRHTIGLKGLKKDGDTSKTYSVRLSETAGEWEHVYPMIRKDGGGFRTEVIRDDMIKALSTIAAIRIRGGYYMGVEKTQLRSLKVTQGVIAGDEKLADSDGECCSDRDRSCTTSDKFELNFGRKGLSCVEYTPISSGKLVVGDSTDNAVRVVKLARDVSSPLPEFYRDSKMEITGGTCGPAGNNAGCSGTVTGYLGELSWAINTGITSVEVEQAGQNCSTGGYLAANGASGSGFKASFDVKYTIPAVTLTAQGRGCSAGTTEGPFTAIAVTNGVVTAVTDATTVKGNGYISGRAIIVCNPPCKGKGLVVDCVANAANVADPGDVTGLTVVSGGENYDASKPPSIYCPEGMVGARTSEGPFSTIVLNGGATTVASVTLPPVLGSGYENGYASIECAPPCTGTGLTVFCNVDNFENGLSFTYKVGDITALTVVNPGTGYSATNPPVITCPTKADDPPNPGTGFAGTYATTGGGIFAVAVTNAGTGYNANIKMTHVSAYQSATCIEMVWKPEPSGYMTGVTVIDIGSGYSDSPPPTLAISSGGMGCMDFVLRTLVGDATPDKLEDTATSGGILSLRGTSSDVRDGYYNGMTMVMLSGDTAGEAREIDTYVSDQRTVYLKTPFTDTPDAGDFYAITKTPALTLSGYLAGIYGTLAGQLDCGGQTTLNGLGAAARGTTVCEVTLASTASTVDDNYNGETIYFPALDLATVIVDYDGAQKKAKVAVRGSGATGYNRELAATSAVGTTAYVISQRNVALVTLATHDGTVATADTDATSEYVLSYRDYTASLQAHARGQPFFCEQVVGADAPWLAMPFTRTFGFRSAPLICSTATLTVAAQGQVRNDILWPGNNVTVRGEHGELLGTLFSEPARFLGMQEGGPVFDSIAISQEKMLEMTSDGDFVISLSTDSEHGRPDVIMDNSGKSIFLRDASMKIRWMKLSFSPAACYNAKVATDEYKVLDSAGAGDEEVVYDLSFQLPPSSTGMPVSDGVLTVTADADLAEGRVEVSYPNASDVSLFSDWVWGKHEDVYAMSEPSNVATTCVNDYSVDLQRYTITGVVITSGGSGCAATQTAGPYSTITVDGTGGVTGVTPSGSQAAFPTGNGYLSGKAIILSHGSGNGALVVSCVANTAGAVTGITIDTKGAGYSVANPPVIYCPEGTIEAEPTMGSVFPAGAANFAGFYATNGLRNGGAIIGVTVTNVGTDYPKDVKIVNKQTNFNSATCTTHEQDGIGKPVLAYQKVVAADPAVPARTCTRATVVPLNSTRSGRHTAHHRIPRHILSSAAGSGVLPVSFKVSDHPLTHACAHAHANVCVCVCVCDASVYEFDARMHVALRLLHQCAPVHPVSKTTGT
jgi:hypothetical protein